MNTKKITIITAIALALMSLTGCAQEMNAMDTYAPMAAGGYYTDGYG